MQNGTLITSGGQVDESFYVAAGTASEEEGGEPSEYSRRMSIGDNVQGKKVAGGKGNGSLNKVCR
jgi:hypothetical protein